MPTTKKLDALKINKLTEAQLATATVSEDELYLVTDAENPVTVKTDSTLNGNGSAEKPLSVSRYISAEVISAKKDGGNPNHLFFETLDNTTAWHMYQYNFESSYVGVGNTKGQIGRVGATLDAVYAAKLCKDSTELSVREGKTGDIAITSELPESKTGTAGQVYTKTETGAEWKDATGGGGGDYLPLSGGIMTGPIRFSYSGSSLYEPRISNTGADIKIGTSFEPDMFIFDMASTGILRPGGYSSDLGDKTYKWRRIYGQKLNNGEDIEIPTTGGTMVVATPPTTAGLVLVSTETGSEWSDVIGNINTLLDTINGEVA